MTPSALRAWLERTGITAADCARRLPCDARAFRGWLQEPQRGRPPEYLERALSDLAREMKAHAETRRTRR